MRQCYLQAAATTTLAGINTMNVEAGHFGDAILLFCAAHRGQHTTLFQIAILYAATNKLSVTTHNVT